MSETEKTPEGFSEVSAESLVWRPYEAFAKDWMALAAGSEKGFNAMTVAWGQVGSLWGKPDGGIAHPVATVYVRPQRYTNEFMKRQSLFTLSHFGQEQRKALGVLGSRSGRDGDKVADAGLTPVFWGDTVFFKEATMVIVCRKIYHTQLVPEGFEDEAIMKANYPERDFHEVYIGEILKMWLHE